MHWSYNIPHLFNILVKFRSHAVGLVADIEKAFLMVGIADVDRDMLRFLWVKNIHEEIPEIIEYRFARLVFGLRPSPAMLGATIDHHLKFYEDKDPVAVRVSKNSLYVDDLVSGAPSDHEALDIYKGTKGIMLAGGFNLGKWASNSNTVVKAITQAEGKVDSNNIPVPESVDTIEPSPPAVIEETKSYTKTTIGQEIAAAKDKCVKVLGTLWNTKNDTFMFDFSGLVKYARSLPVTKRSVLKVTSKIFDPVGFLTPFVIMMKALFQELCIEGNEWYDELKEGLRARWNTLLVELSTLNDLRIQRCYFKSTEKPMKTELHGFSDASKIAYAAVIYMRSLYESGNVEVKLVASKSKVAPLKGQTIPRLELLGATILARLIAKVHECLFEGDCNDQKIEIINWTDSMTVLCSIANDKLWKQYVMHRVEEIRRLTAKDSWRFCPGTENPADLPSRGVKADDLVSNRLWWDGPEFLHKSEHEWPKHSSEKPDTALAEEVKKQPVVTHSLITKGSKPNPLDITKSMECEIFGTLIRLFRVTAYVLRFINNIKKTTKNLKPTKTMKPKGLSASEINAAENIWIRSIQNASFPLEIEYLSGKRHGSIPNRVLQFGLFIDEKGLLRCEGRINKANIPRESKNPILLPSKHPIVDLIVRDVHHQVKHNGIRDTLTTVRERFWILRGREVVKRILKK